MAIATTDLAEVQALGQLMAYLTGLFNSEANIATADRKMTPENIAALNVTLGLLLARVDEFLQPNT